MVVHIYNPEEHQEPKASLGYGASSRLAGPLCGTLSQNKTKGKREKQGEQGVGEMAGMKQSKADSRSSPCAEEENCRSSECDEEKPHQVTNLAATERCRRDLLYATPQDPSQEMWSLITKITQAFFL